MTQPECFGSFMFQRFIILGNRVLDKIFWKFCLRMGAGLIIAPKVIWILSGQNGVFPLAPFPACLRHAETAWRITTLQEWVLGFLMAGTAIVKTGSECRWEISWRQLNLGDLVDAFDHLGQLLGTITILTGDTCLALRSRPWDKNELLLHIRLTELCHGETEAHWSQSTLQDLITRVISVASSWRHLSHMEECFPNRRAQGGHDNTPSVSLRIRLRIYKSKGCRDDPVAKHTYCSCKGPGSVPSI